MSVDVMEGFETSENYLHVSCTEGDWGGGALMAEGRGRGVYTKSTVY